MFREEDSMRKEQTDLLLGESRGGKEFLETSLVGEGNISSSTSRKATEDLSEHISFDPLSLWDS